MKVSGTTPAIPEPGTSARLALGASAAAGRAATRDYHAPGEIESASR